MQVAIIGAGINGLYLSWKLSKAGHNVTIFDKKEKIGDNIVCSGLFSERIFDFIPQSRNLVKNRINCVNIHFPKKTIKVAFSKPFYVIDHADLDKLVAKKTKAKIILNKSIEEIPKEFDRVIGCDGANSIIRKKLGIKNPKFRLGSLKYSEKQGENSSRPIGRELFSPCKSFVEVWPSRTGFSWKIPRDGSNMEIGEIADFSEIEKKPGFYYKVIPQGLVIPKNKNITLCGDAAGLTKPWSGGGVVWGLAAANMLLKNFPDFLAYRREVRKFFVPKIAFSKSAVKIVNFCGFRIPFILPKKAGMESDFLL